MSSKMNVAIFILLKTHVNHTYMDKVDRQKYVNDVKLKEDFAKLKRDKYY